MISDWREKILVGSLGGGLVSLGLLGGSGLLGTLALLLLGGIGGASSLALSVVGRSPQSQVVAQELHDQSAVAVRLLGEGVKLGNGIIKCLLGQMASAVGRVQDLVVEDGEVQSQTQADGVSRSEISLSNVGGVLVGETVSVNDRGV